VSDRNCRELAAPTNHAPPAKSNSVALFLLSHYHNVINSRLGRSHALRRRAAGAAAERSRYHKAVETSTHDRFVRIELRSLHTHLT
jgi:hypothetical protein